MSGREILDQALAGRRLDDVFILDCHGHLDMWKAMAGLPCDAEAIIESMDRVGIDMLCINKWNCPDVVQANTDIGDAIRKYPKRFVGYAATQPCLGKDATLHELHRCFDELGCTGIKIHYGYETLPMRDRWSLADFQVTMNAIYEFAAERECSLLCHWDVPVDVIQRYPSAKFILAHALAFRQSADLYGPYPNAYFDTAASLTLRGNLDYFMHKVGVDRILYGSDMPFSNPAYRLGQIVGTRVEDRHLRQILGGNMARILNISGRQG